MTTIKDVAIAFGLNRIEQRQLESCVQTYSGNSLTRRILNACCCPCGRSDWQIVESSLNTHATIVLENRFGAGQGNPQAVSQYVLNFLISQAAGTEPLLGNQPADVDEMVDLAAYGDGTTLKTLPRFFVVMYLKNERTALMSDVGEFSHYLDHDLEQDVNREVRSLAQGPSGIGNAIGVPIEQAKKPIDGAKENIAKIERLIQETAYVEDSNTLNQKTDQDLYIELKRLRKARKSFNQTAKNFRAAATGN